MRILLAFILSVATASAANITNLYVGQALSVGTVLTTVPSAPEAACGVLFCENFEGWTNYARPGSPWTATVNSGWYLDWTTTSNPGSTIANADTTGLSLEGANCFHMIDGAGDYPIAYSPAFTAQSECWVYLEWRGHVLSGQFGVVDVDLNKLAYMTSVADASVVLYHGSASANLTLTASVDTTYYAWLHYVAGSGANGVASVGTTNSASRPTTGAGFAATSSGTATASAARVFVSVTGAGNYYFDKVRVYSGSTPPADNPN